MKRLVVQIPDDGQKLIELETAKILLSKANPHSESIAECMRALFYSDYLTDEMVEIYNALEERWKSIKEHTHNYGKERNWNSTN